MKHKITIKWALCNKAALRTHPSLCCEKIFTISYSLLYSFKFAIFLKDKLYKSLTSLAQRYIAKREAQRRTLSLSCLA